MSVPSSGIIRMSDLKAVFGGSGTLYMSNYYQNASSGYTNNVPGIPTSGNMLTLGHFRGKSKPVMGLSFSRDYVEGNALSSWCTEWTTFCQGLTGTYSYINLKGTYDTKGRSTSSSTIATGIASALRNGVDYSAYDSATGYTWAVGTCGGIRALSASGYVCQCDPYGYVFRPCILNNNWGGVNTVTCSSPSQNMTVTFA